MGRLDYKFLLESEIGTSEYARSYLRGFVDKVPVIIDTLLQLGYFTGDNKGINTLDDEFHSYCFHKYIQIPYSFRGAYILYSLGYFHEATFIIRHLFETLVKMKYLINHKDYIESVWKNKSINIELENGKKRG